MLVAACVTACVHSPRPSPPSVARATGGPEILFFDDFSAAGLDRSRWNVRVTGITVNNEQQAYVDGTDALSVENGALVIEARHRPGFVTPEGKTFDFVSGRIDTRGTFEFTYGTAEARMKLPAGSGLWPAFWAMGTGRWPETGEIDIMEAVGEPDWTSVALHGPGYSGETPLVNKVFFDAKADATAWHVYAVDWSADALLFRVDGALIYRATRPMVEHYGRWSFDNPKYLILNLALGGTYPGKTNGVKGRYPGLPDDTVHTIEKGRARVLVDWVRVTRKR